MLWFDIIWERISYVIRLQHVDVFGHTVFIDKARSYLSFIILLIHSCRRLYSYFDILGYSTRIWLTVSSACPAILNFSFLLWSVLMSDGLDCKYDWLIFYLKPFLRSDNWSLFFFSFNCHTGSRYSAYLLQSFAKDIVLLDLRLSFVRLLLQFMRTPTIILKSRVSQWHIYT